MKSIKLTYYILSMCVASFIFGACGVIPQAYRGNFVDDSSGAKLELKTSDGTLVTASGRVLTAKADQVEFDKLLAGQAGIYVSQNQEAKDCLEVYWIGPKPETRQEAGGLVWFESETLYTLMNTKQKGKVDNLELTHCEAGSTLLDPSTKRWQIGCPAGALRYQFRRVAE